MVNKRTEWIIYIILVIISALISLLILEKIVRGWQSSQEKNNDVSGEIWSIKEETKLEKLVKEKKINETTFNVYYFGESSMAGEPFIDTIPILVEKNLRGKIAGKQIKWINLGEAGNNLNGVQEQIKILLTKKEIYYPSLIIIYSGHNEFLGFQDDIGFSINSKSKLVNWIAKTFKWYRLEIDDRKFFDKEVVTAKQKEETLNNYQNEMKEIINLSRENKIPLIVSTVAGNYSDFEPNRSIYQGSTLRKNEFEKLVYSAKNAFRQGKNQEAIDGYKKALEIDSYFPEALFGLGKVEEKVGNYQEAWQKYVRAIDNDGMPIRAVSIQNEFIKNLKEDEFLKIADSVSYLREKSDNSLIGNNLMADGHHPNLNGYRLISEVISKKIKELYPEKTELNYVSQKEAENYFYKNNGYYSMLISRADWLIRLSTWRFDPEERLNMADEYLNEAIKIKQDDGVWYLDKMLIADLKKDKKEAEKYLNEANKVDPWAVKNYTEEYWIKQVIERASDNQ